MNQDSPTSVQARLDESYSSREVLQQIFIWYIVGIDAVVVKEAEYLIRLVDL